MKRGKAGTPRSTLRVPGDLYSRESLEAGARAVAGEARVTFLKSASREHRLRVEAAAGSRLDAAGAADELLNEALGREHRRDLLGLAKARVWPALERLLADGFRPGPEDRLEHLEPRVADERRRDVEALLRSCRGREAS